MTLSGSLNADRSVPPQKPDWVCETCRGLDNINWTSLKGFFNLAMNICSRKREGILELQLMRQRNVPAQRQVHCLIIPLGLEWYVYQH